MTPEGMYEPGDLLYSDAQLAVYKAKIAADEERINAEYDRGVVFANPRRIPTSTGVWCWDGEKWVRQ